MGLFKPYLFIGIAYLVIAVIGGAMMMKVAFNDNFTYTGTYYPAMKFGFLAGCLGALGALFPTFALTKAGGKPAYVMPIVFGGAVSVNAVAAFLSLKQGETAESAHVGRDGIRCCRYHHDCGEHTSRTFPRKNRIRLPRWREHSCDSGS